MPPRFPRFPAPFMRQINFTRLLKTILGEAAACTEEQRMPPVTGSRSGATGLETSRARSSVWCVRAREGRGKVGWLGVAVARVKLRAGEMRFASCGVVHLQRLEGSYVEH
ncbi:hypothetical protein COCMIDRAFT_29028 [Bipolaris oryzae ATCC 44560]|uniref:Uncharacterized protein n=1 Tax=Bipolaris oryzae ATCC 44560 TaxID=930090 RepID=W6ZFP8_COCMI|nr:uncharacterized protein COCMIDRAFT_29028 [Bipolaris oryzae ATCC 44560]EUC42321.1 hypothetical protein COCMIDRAFT_29028 [Bipolaris oryzae ATCC 44560]